MNYDPNLLINAMLDRLKLKNDAALSRLLGFAPPVISKIRHRKLPLGSALLIRLHELTGMNTRDLRKIAGDRRKSFRCSAKENYKRLKEAA